MHARGRQSGPPLPDPADGTQADFVTRRVTLDITLRDIPGMSARTSLKLREPIR